MASPTKTSLDQNIQLGQQAANISASQNNWDPGGTVMNCGLLGVNTLAAGCHVTGIRSDSVTGRLFGVVTRGGANDPFTLDHDSGSSTIANRMYLPGAANLDLRVGGVAGARPGILMMWIPEANHWMGF